MQAETLQKSHWMSIYIINIKTSNVYNVYNDSASLNSREMTPKDTQVKG